MSDWNSIKTAIDEQGSAFDEFKKVNDARLKAVADGNESKAAELSAKLDKIEAAVKAAEKAKSNAEIELQNQRERIEELESRSRQPAASVAEKRRGEYKAAFVNWLRQSNDQELGLRLHEAQKKMVEAKDVTVGSSAGGGYALPEEISRQIEQLERMYSPVRNLVNVVQVGTTDYKELIDLYGETSGWVGESTARPATSTPQLREVAPTFGELYCYPQASEWSLDDLFFNVEDWLARAAAREFALQEGDAVIRGNGTSKPTGMLNTAPTTADDAFPPTRAAAAYQYIQSSGSPNELDFDLLISLVYKVNPAYRAMGTFAMNSVTTGHVRRLKDLNNQYLWQPSTQVGQPASLLGYPVATWEQLQDVGAGAGNFPVAFGDFKRAYTLCDRVGLRVTRDNVTNIGFVRFYIRRREGGIVTNNDAIKFIRT